MIKGSGDSRPQVSEGEGIIGKCASTKKKSDNVLNLDILEALCFQRSIRFRGKMFVKRKKPRRDLRDLSDSLRDAPSVVKSSTIQSLISLFVLDRTNFSPADIIILLSGKLFLA